jgi:hypothetical protein
MYHHHHHHRHHHNRLSYVPARSVVSYKQTEQPLFLDPHIEKAGKFFLYDSLDAEVVFFF